MVRWFEYKKSPKVSGPMLISCVDGKCFHGGLCDRFKGIVSTYFYCKRHDIPFKIHYTFPCALEKYLIPNQYDWTLKEGEYQENIHASRILYLCAEDKPSRLYTPRTKQVHVYANRDTTPLQDRNMPWGQLFNELFKPSKRLSEAIGQLNFGKYIALVFRFQNLLGDFQEYNFKPIKCKEQDNLISLCKEAIGKFQDTYPQHNILITADSMRFLDAVRHIPGICTIPGIPKHIDSPSAKNNEESVLKSFVDFFMISKAEKVFSVGTKRMYPSEFPLYASKVNDVPFERVILSEH